MGWKTAVLWCLIAGIVPGIAQAQGAGDIKRLILDDFENGVGAWTRNDKVKSDSPASGVVLVDLVATRPPAGGPARSNGAGLFAFKDAKNSWASASLRVNGADWAKIGAQKLTFWLNADGEFQGTELVLRGKYRDSKGVSREEAFYLPIRLNVKKWRQVAIPLRETKNANGPLLSRLHGIYLIQFVQRGTWGSRFFTIDQLQVEGNGIPIAAPKPATPTPAPATVPVAESSDSAVITVNVDFLATQGKLRTRANVSIGGSVPDFSGTMRDPLSDSTEFRQALAKLSPRFVRLESGGFVELVDSSRPTFDFTRLVAAAARVRSLKGEPLIALTNDPAWGLDARAYASYCGQAANALKASRALQGTAAVRYFELPTAATTADDNEAIALYNQARTAVKAVSQTYRVGGIGATSGRKGALSGILNKASGLDFLALQHFGVYTDQQSDQTVLTAAGDLARLRAVAVALDRSKWKAVPIYLTQANLNGQRVDGGTLPSDGRMGQMISAVWWASFLTNQSRLADEVFHNDATNPEWGLLDANYSPNPAYGTFWLWNTFFPKGSQRVKVINSAPGLVTLAVNTPTAHNVLVANPTGEEVTAKVAIRGFPILRQARIRSLDGRSKEVVFGDLPKSPYQDLTLRPYAVAVLQFIEGQKK
jgi:hypothetical protein